MKATPKAVFSQQNFAHLYSSSNGLLVMQSNEGLFYP